MPQGHLDWQEHGDLPCRKRTDAPASRGKVRHCSVGSLGPASVHSLNPWQSCEMLCACVPAAKSCPTAVFALLYCCFT